MLYSRLVVLCIASALLASCAKPPPSNPHNACGFLKDRPLWFSAVDRTEERWNIPKYVTLAIIHQESSFRSDAVPPREKLLGFIPWFRISSAYGYSQALDGSWDEYVEETDRWYARRGSFADSADFIGWYNRKSVRDLGINRRDAYSLYLAYHEGRRGYKRKSYNKKAWLKRAARKVQRNSERYRKQIKRCEHRLYRPWYDFLPFTS